MANHKFLMEDVFEEEYDLVAIHCVEEAYKIAYLINKYTNLRLHRKERDLDFSYDGTEVFYPIFEFNDEHNYINYTLVANRCKSIPVHVMSSGGLFEEIENSVTHFLLPEMKKVDYFLKIHSESNVTPVKNIITSIHKIKQVISAYSIAVENIKQKNNLIFD